jgi:hypothetical protein
MLTSFVPPDCTQALHAKSAGDDIRYAKGQGISYVKITIGTK